MKINVKLVMTISSINLIGIGLLAGLTIIPIAAGNHPSGR
jgi:hypothetical protein